MEQRNNLVLQGTETFSRGQLDNLALENGALVLDSVAGRSLLYGSYTTPEFAMPAFCNLNVSWNAHAPRDTMVEVRCRVYAAGAWTSWMSFGKWAPDYPRASISTHSDDGLIFLMGDTVTVALPGGGTGVQLQVNLSTNNDKVTPALRLLAAAVRPLAWDKQSGHPINRRLYLPEYCLSAHDPSFGRDMDLPLVMAALMNRWGEDILPEEVAYVMEDKTTGSKRKGVATERRFCRRGSGLLRFSLLAGVDGPAGPAGADTRRLFRGRAHRAPHPGPAGPHRGLDGSAGLRPRRRGPRRFCPAQRPHRRQRRSRELHDGSHGFCPLLHRAGHRPPPQAPGHRGQPPPAGLLRLCVQRRG